MYLASFHTFDPFFFFFSPSISLSPVSQNNPFSIIPPPLPQKICKSNLEN